MSNIRTIGSSFEQGLRMPNYVNGRTLHAEDLRAEQEATFQRLSNLGQAIGPGIVEGLQVETASATSLSVSPGIGLNPEGHVIHLSGVPVTLSVTIQPEAETFLGNAGLFQNCVVATSGTFTSIETGAYLLTVVPASRLEGSVPVNSVASRGNTAECAARWIAEGLEFRAIRLTKFGNNGVDTGTANTRRNRLAHWAFDSNAHPTTSYMMGLSPQTLYARLSADLTPCDLLLGVFYWADNTITFVDNWAVRRAVAPEYPDSPHEPLIGSSRRVNGQARFSQFQDQLDLITRTTANLATVSAADYFRYLPPLGFLPVRLAPRAANSINTLIFQIMQQFITQAWPLLTNFQINSQLILLIATELTQQISQPILSRLTTAGYSIGTFFGENTDIHVAQVDVITLEKAIQHSWHDQRIDLMRSPQIDIYLLQEVIRGLVYALVLNRVDTTGFATVNIGFAGLFFPSIPGPLITQAWKQIGMPAQLKDSIGVDSDALVAAIKQPNTPLIYAAFVRREQPIDFFNADG